MSAEKEISLTIKGFRNPEEAQAFFSWYEGQGEQDASIWFEELQNRGKLDVSTMNADMQKRPKWNEDQTNLTAWVKPQL